jgi:hypothetical protein
MIAAWVAPPASAALISFLAQSSRNLSPSARGGRQIADHIAGVLASRDPEPHVGFVVIGPSDHGWASLLHGPVQAWDGARWLAPAPSPGWIQAIITPRPAITVGPAGTPTPPAEPDAMWDLEAGIVPGAGFVLIPAARPVRPVAVRAGDSEPGSTTDTSVLTPPGATSVLPAVDPDAADAALVIAGAAAVSQREDEEDEEADEAPAPVPEPVPVPEPARPLVGQCAPAQRGRWTCGMSAWPPGPRCQEGTTANWSSPAGPWWLAWSAREAISTDPECSSASAATR